MRKILITGATGFIGNYVIKELLKNNEITVIASSRDKNKAEKFEWFNNVIYVSYDLEKSFTGSLKKYFHDPDCLIHLAWDGLLDYNNSKHIDNYLIEHYNFIKQFMEDGLKDISISGTCLEIGMKEGRIDEEITTNPITKYGLAKDTLRKFLEITTKQYNVSLKWIRLFYLYGVDQRENSLIGHLQKSIKDNSKTFPMSGGEQLRDYLPVKTVAKYIVQIALQKNVTGVINCCSGEPISVRRFVEDYIKILNSRIELELGKYPYPNHEPFAFWGDKTKLNLILDSY